MDEPSSGTSNRELRRLLRTYAYGDGDASSSKWRELASSPLQPLAITPVTFLAGSNGGVEQWRLASQQHPSRQAGSDATAVVVFFGAPAPTRQQAELDLLGGSGTCKWKDRQCRGTERDQKPTMALPSPSRQPRRVGIVAWSRGRRTPNRPAK